MQWYETAARLTERHTSNTRYDTNGFAAILRKYDSDRNKILNAEELQTLLNKMLARYKTSISKLEAQDILTSFNASAGIGLNEFAAQVVKLRGKHAETYTRLLSNMLSHATQSECAQLNCVARDPFAPKSGSKSALGRYICMPQQPEGPVAPHACMEISSQETKGGSSEIVDVVLTRPNVPPTPLDDPFAGVVIGGVAQDGQAVQFLTPHSHNHAGETALEIWNKVQEDGACSGDHCSEVDPKVQNAIVAIGKTYNPVIHTPASSDIRDAEIAKALGAPIWAQFENAEIMENGFDMARPFNPAPVKIHSAFAQSPTLGFYKGALAKGQDPQKFIDTGAHNETAHFDTPGERLSARYDVEQGVQVAGVYNLALSDKGSSQISAVLGRDQQAVRLDSYRTINKTGTLGIGGTAMVNVQNFPATDDQEAFTRDLGYEISPMLYKTAAHFTVGAGVLLGDQAPMLRTDFSILDWWSARNAFRITSDVNGRSASSTISVTSETSHFLRPTYEFSYSVVAGQEQRPEHALSGEYKKQLTTNHGVFAEAELMTSAENQVATLELGSLHAFGAGQNWAAGPKFGVNAAQGNVPQYSFGGALNLLDVKRDIALNLDAGLTLQSGAKPQPNIGLTMQYSGIFRR